MMMSDIYPIRLVTQVTWERWILSSLSHFSMQIFGRDLSIRSVREMLAFP
jgi:hypothetical protein